MTRVLPSADPTTTPRARAGADNAPLKLLELQAYRNSAWMGRLLMEVVHDDPVSLDAAGGPLAVALSRLGARAAQALLAPLVRRETPVVQEIERHVFSLCTTARRLAHYSQLDARALKLPEAQLLGVLAAQPLFGVLETPEHPAHALLQDALARGRPMAHFARQAPQTLGACRTLARSWGADAELDATLVAMHTAACETLEWPASLVRASHWALAVRAGEPVDEEGERCARSNRLLQRLRDRGLDPVAVVMRF